MYMDKEDLQRRIDGGEGQFTEFKSNENNYAKDMVAFANSSGGKLIIGINNKNNYTQLGNINDIKSNIRSTARNCEDPVPIKKIEEVDGRVVVHIAESPESHRCSDGWFMREGANSQKQSKQEVIEILKRKREIQFGNTFSSKFNYPEEFSLEEYKQFLDEAGITDNINPEDLLANLGVVEENDGEIRFTNAGILMFAKNPKKYFTQAEIVCNCYKSNEKVDIKDREVIEEPIITSIRKTIHFIENNLDTRVVIEDLKRREEPEMPKEVLREAVANAVMHRDYHRSSESIHIDIFPDRLEIRNPGGLMQGMREEDLGQKSMRRNELLANMLDKAEFVERSGTGINRMKKAMEEHNLPRPEFDTNSHFLAVLKRENTLNKSLDQSKLNDRQLLIINRFRDKGEITSSEYQKTVNNSSAIEGNISKRTAIRDLNELVQKEIVTKIGEKRSTTYLFNS